MKNVNFVPKDVQRILSSHTISDKYNEQKVFHKKAVPKNFAIFAGKHLCWNIFFNKNEGLQACAIIKTPTQVFSYEYWEIFNYTYFDVSLKKKKTVLKPATWKKLVFSWCFLSFRFSLFLQCRSGGDDSSEGFKKVLQKNFILYILEGSSNYASLAVSFSWIVNKITCEYRGGGSQMLLKIGAPKNFENLTGKTPALGSLFKKVAGSEVCNFIKNRLQHRCFSVKFENFLRAPFFTKHLRWLVFKISNSNNSTICSKIFHQYPLRTTNLWSPTTLTMTK